jgi:uncharacterized protein YneF (UPF0154 family)
MDIMAGAWLQITLAVIIIVAGLVAGVILLRKSDKELS